MESLHPRGNPVHGLDGEDKVLLRGFDFGTDTLLVRLWLLRILHWTSQIVEHFLRGFPRSACLYSDFQELGEVLL